MRGILPPLVTPFDADGRVDRAAFESNLDAYAAEDLGGYLVLGSNGEAASLDEDEKLALVRAVRERARGRLVLAGTGLESTRGTIDLTRKAAHAGADGALVLTPHYYRPQMGAEALRRFYLAVADASPIPVYLYSVPVFTGLPIPPALPADVAHHPRIAGMKDSSGDVGALGRVIASVPASFAVACGSAPVLFPSLCIGASAGILAVACCAPGVAAALFRAFEKGDHGRARRIQEALTPLASAVTATWGVAGLKKAMDLAGLKGGAVRAPLLDAPADAHRELPALLERAKAAAAA